MVTNELFLYYANHKKKLYVSASGSYPLKTINKFAVLMEIMRYVELSL